MSNTLARRADPVSLALRNVPCCLPKPNTPDLRPGNWIDFG